MKIRKACTLLISALLLFFLSGCWNGKTAPSPGNPGAAAGTADHQEQITLNVWEVWPEKNDANAKSFYDTLAKWQEEHPNI
ncbi:MAG: hypothetical protein FWC60_10280, partial [Firmicutes bacterium]|nr:hypothetical protein [Bacillota bacterium]